MRLLPREQVGSNLGESRFDRLTDLVVIRPEPRKPLGQTHSS